MCDDDVLMVIYRFLKDLLKSEFKGICQKIITNELLLSKNKKRKIRKKMITITTPH